MNAGALSAAFLLCAVPVGRPQAQAPDAPAVSPRELATRATGLRVLVSVDARRLWVIGADGDTLLSAPIAVGKGTSLRYRDQRWAFHTPRGVRWVMRKEVDPVWVPPDWFYVEVARQYDLAVAELLPDRPVALSDGRVLTLRDDIAGVIGSDSHFGILPLDEHIVFDGTLFIPPLGSRNRQVEGELGKYRLDLGDGIALHGTPATESIGAAATHGCIRLRDVDIAWMYEFVPVGARVYIY